MGQMKAEKLEIVKEKEIKKRERERERGEERGRKKKIIKKYYIFYQGFNLYFLINF